MFFEHPLFLWLLPIAPALAYAAWRASGVRRLSTAIVHGLCVAVAVLALAGPMVSWPTTSETHVRVVELTPFVSDRAVADAVRGSAVDERSRVVVFANRAERIDDLAELQDATRLRSLRSRLAEKIWPDDPATGGPNVSTALALAAAQIPVDGRGDVDIIAGGGSLHGDAAAEAYRLAERGIRVRATAMDLSTDSLPPVLIRRVSLPGRARVGQTLRATLDIDAAVAGDITVRLTAGDADPVTTTLAVTPGVHRATLNLPFRKPGLQAVRAAVDAAGQSHSEGGDIVAAVDVSPPADVLLVQDRANANGLAAFATLLGDGVRLIPTTPEAVAEQASHADAVILDDTPADRLSADAHAALLAAVHDGTGLMLTGAARSFGPGGYDESPLAAALPVKMPQQAESIDPSVTLVLIIDSSGSMMGERMDLAKEIARLAMSHLKPHDKVGIVEFYGGKRWAAPIQTAANVSIIQRALDRLTAGGGTTLYPAVEEAAFALRNVRTRGKHLLILSDGAVEEAKFAALIRRMAEDGISISAAQVGPPDGGGMANMMPDFARWGNGRYYTVPDAYSLPDISFKQPQISMLSPVLRTPTAIVAGDDELARDAVRHGPATLNGYLRTQAKPTADVLLKTAGGDPLLARWRYGAGYVATLPTQIGSTMTSTLNAGVVDVIRGVARQLSDGRSDPLAVTATVRPAGVEVGVAASTADGIDSTRPVTVSLRDTEGRVLRRVTAEPTAAGHWNVLLANVTAGAYSVSAELAGLPHVGRAGVAVMTPESAIPREPDRGLLARLESFAGLAAERAAALPPAGVAFIDLTPWAALAAMVLLVAHVARRRWPLMTNR